MKFLRSQHWTYNSVLLRPFSSASLRFRRVLLIGALLGFTTWVSAQDAEKTKSIFSFKGNVSATNNGFSFIPSFSLGKPAAIVTLAASGKRLSFEPEFRYSLAGKPWSFIFIWRYKLVKTNKFQFTVGTHLPALNFTTVEVVKNGTTQDIIQARQFFPVIEVMPNVALTKNINLGVFALYGRSVEKRPVSNTFISLRSSFSNIPLYRKLYFRFSPQVYYLQVGERDGYYTAAGLTLARRNFPISISTLVNKAIRTDIAGKDFDWNVSLVYSFDKNFTR